MLFKNNSGQGGAEYLLLFGAVIIIAIASLLIYDSYFTGTPYTAANDINQMRNTSSNSSSISLTLINNGPIITSSLRYEVYDKNGNLIVASRVISTSSNGTFNIGSYPTGSTLKLHETLNNKLKDPITSNVQMTAASNGKTIINAKIAVLVNPDKFVGAPGNWYSSKI